MQTKNQVSIELDDPTTFERGYLRNFTSGMRYIRVDHGQDGRAGENLLHFSRRNAKAKTVLVELAASGFYCYMHSENQSRFVAHDSMQNIWSRLTSGEYSRSKDGVVYNLIDSLDQSPKKKLLVVFSSMDANPYTSSLTRYFVQNFSTIQKFIPRNTSVLRIADFGGVIGSFYMNTTARPHNAQHIQDLIKLVIAENNIPVNDVVLYEASKGGTGALYHGLLGDYKTVSVDPIVSDTYYVSKLKDFHFTLGPIYAAPKEKTFIEVLNGPIQVLKPGTARQAVIYSERSPIFESIDEVLLQGSHSKLLFLNSHNPGITDHPDVSPLTLNSTIMSINMFLNGLSLPTGVREIDKY